MPKKKTLWPRSLWPHRLNLILGFSFITALMLSNLQGQNTGPNARQDSAGVLQWVESDKKDTAIGSKGIGSKGIVSKGIVSKRRGWLHLEQQDCTKPQNLEAGDGKQICEEKPAAKYVQEYLLKFSYLPDNIDTKFPFGIPLEFQLRIDRVQENERYFWLVALSNRSEGSTIPLDRKELQANAQTKAQTDAQGQVPNPRSAQRELKRELKRLQKEQEQEALNFLKGYFTCLRQNREC